MKKINKILIIFLISICLVSCESISKSKKIANSENNVPFFKYNDFKNVGKINGEWYLNYRVIAHALGGIDNIDYTNSYEALVNNYNLGTRVFETDISYTSDGYMVLLHEWNQYHKDYGIGEKNGWSEENIFYFRNNKIFGKYTTMTFDDLLYIMDVIDDLYIVIDSKTFDLESTVSIYDEIIKKINDINPELLKRIIPQAYTPEIYKTLSDYELFDDIIFTLYHYYAESDGYKIFNVIKEYKIKSIVMHMDDDWAVRVIRDIRDYALYDDEWDYSNFNIYIHTINDEEIAKNIVEHENFYGIYSDFISESRFSEIVD